MTHRVLVVDDDELVRNNLALVLRMEGYDVSTAESGRVALDVVEQATPSAIVLDISMPGMSGWETLARLRERPAGRAAPVIALTGDRVDPATFRRAGFNGYLAKGGSLDRFLRTLRATIEMGARGVESWISPSGDVTPTRRSIQ